MDFVIAPWKWVGGRWRGWRGTHRNETEISDTHGRCGKVGVVCCHDVDLEEPNE